MSTQAPSLGGRLPLLKPDDLDPDQRKIHASIADKLVPWANESGFQADAPDGSLIGPFNPMLYSPKVSQGNLAFVQAEQEHTALGKTVREVVILTVGAIWGAAYEIYAHSAVGKKAGLAPEVIETLAAGRTPETLSIDESVAHEFTRSLVADRRVDQELYLRAVETFGEKGVVDMIYLAGNYMTVSALLNTFEVPVPTAPVADTDRRAA